VRLLTFVLSSIEEKRNRTQRVLMIDVTIALLLPLHGVATGRSVKRD
jgi:hypothetical protein